MAKEYLLKPSQPKLVSKIDYKKELNPEQQRVVFSGDGPCLVLAGPGSGKTRTLIYRVAYLLDKGVAEEQILLVTFTKRAAEEMIRRVKGLLGYEPKKLWAGTFHHIGNLVLRKYADRLGYSRNYTILDSEDSLTLLRTVIEDNHLSRDEYFPKPKLLKQVLKRSEGSGLSIERTVDKFFPFIKENAPDAQRLLKKFQKIKTLYQKKKKRQNLMDYTDLLLNWRCILENYPEIKTSLDKRFKYILVDEFQDISSLQGKIIHLLCQDISNVLVVGDDSQSIYSFRGASIDNIFDFQKKFNPSIFRLETNYRSTPAILEIANNSIRYNTKRFDKTLRTQNHKGPIPKVVSALDAKQQAQFVVQRLLDISRDGVALSDIAVLYRSHFLSADLELELIRRGIPYIIRSGLRFYERKHIKDILAFYRILLNPQEELSWRRLLQLQPGIGRIYSGQIYSQIIQQLDRHHILGFSPQGVSEQAQQSWRRLQGIFANILDLWDKKPKRFLIKISQYVLDHWYKEYLSSQFADASQRLEDISHLSLLLERYENVQKFLSDISLSETFAAQRAAGYQQGYEDSVVLSTIHQAKGLEWDTVFIIGLIDGWLPHWRAKNTQQDLEEERRIFYVAVTRAKRRLYLTYPLKTNSFTYNMKLATPSPFIKELNHHLYRKWEARALSA